MSIGIGIAVKEKTKETEPQGSGVSNQRVFVKIIENDRPFLKRKRTNLAKSDVHHHAPQNREHSPMSSL